MLPIPGLQDWRIQAGSRDLGSWDLNPYFKVKLSIEGKYCTIVQPLLKGTDNH